MLLACLTAVFSVLVGASLGLVGPGRALGPIRALALGASLATVFGVLIPEAVGEGGALALIPFFIGLLLPGLFERFSSGLLRTDGQAVALELGYVGLLVHQLGDGLAMGAFAGPGHEGHGHWEVLAAIFGHTVPIVAAVVIAFAAAKGRGSACVRAAGLALAAVGGVLVTTSPGASAMLAAHHAWVSAVTAGLLLHVVLHGIDVAPPITSAARAGELVAFALGAAIPVVAGHGASDAHDHGGGIGALLPIALAVAPALVVGIAVAALVSARRGTSYLTRFDPLLPRVMPLALFGMVVLAAFAHRTSHFVWPAVVAAIACAVPAFLIDRGANGVGALVRAAVVFASAVGLSVGAGMTGVDPAVLGAMAILTLAAVVVRAALVIGIRAVFGALLPLHDHALHDHGLHDHRGHAHHGPH